jgi:O-succinylbenzoic acid--CoA ligase
MIIHIEDKEFSLTDFLFICENEVERGDSTDWKHSIYRFFLDWHNDSDGVDVQTSGSTGKPKTITLLKKHMMASAQATIRFLDCTPGEWAWLCLSVNYIAGKMMIVRALTGNLNLWISKPDTKTTLPALDKIGLTAMVPMQLEPWIKDPWRAESLDKKISHLLIGGTFISDSLERSLQQIKHIALWHTYGMTETISHVALRRINGQKRSDTFSTLPGITITQNKQDCLVIDYPQIGVNNLQTHDLVKLISSTSFTLEGRSDWIINSGGIKINPIKVERMLEGKLPGSFVIFWLPDPVLGQKAILCIENDGSLLPQICFIWKTIEEHYKESHLLREIHFFEAFIRSESGKIRREATVFSLKEKLEGNKL